MTFESSPGLFSRLNSQLSALRTDGARRRRALAGAVFLGLVLTWIHWVGLIVAGALVGLTRRRGRRAVLSGLAFGTVALLATILLGSVSVGEFAALKPVNYLTTATSLLLPVWGSLVRYVI